MLDRLDQFPFLVAKLKVPSEFDFTTGELRLLADTSTINGSSVDCDLILLRFLKEGRWKFSQSFEQKTVGRSTLTRVDERTFEVHGEAMAVLRLPEPAEEEKEEGVVGAGSDPRTVKFSFESRLRMKRGFSSGWQVNLKVDVDSPSGPREIKAEGTMRLYPKPADLPALDSSNTFKGEMFLPLVPVVLARRASTEHFEKLCREAHGVWFEGCRVMIEDVGKTLLEIGDDIREEAESGSTGRLERKLSRLRLDGVPVVLVDGFNSSTTGKGQTESTTPLASWTIMASNPGNNAMLLAHEVGHILGGNHDGEVDAEHRRWYEETVGPSLMTPIGHNSEHPRFLGKMAQAHAPRWALFREVPNSFRGSSEMFIGRLLNLPRAFRLWVSPAPGLGSD